MRLGVVGLVPGDPRAITPGHLEKVRALGLTAACYHGSTPELFEITREDCERANRLYREEQMDLAQFGIGYGQCLFDPDKETRRQALRIIHRGLEVAAMLRAQHALIRTGSLSPEGSYAPSTENYRPGRMEQLVETLREIAVKADQEDVTVVIETHALTIMGSPEINRQVIEAVGSSRMRVVMDFVNHFQSLDQVYHSTDRINHIFDVMGAIAPIGHVKDIRIENRLVLHIAEEAPGQGVLDLATALRRWEARYPDGYMLVEHLSDERIPEAVAGVRRIAENAGVPIH